MSSQQFIRKLADTQAKALFAITSLSLVKPLAVALAIYFIEMNAFLKESFTGIALSHPIVGWTVNLSLVFWFCVLIESSSIKLRIENGPRYQDLFAAGYLMVLGILLILIDPLGGPLSSNVFTSMCAFVVGITRIRAKGPLLTHFLRNLTELAKASIQLPTQFGRGC